MLISLYEKLADVQLPGSKNRQHYMIEVDLAKPVMPEGLEEYLDVVLTLCKSAGVTSGKVFVTIDEKEVKKGESQRRPKPHVDGCFVKRTPAKVKQDRLHEAVFGGYWGHTPGWLHNCNNVQCSDEFKRMPVIVAASVPGCRAWKGKFDGEPKDDGDLSHIQDQLGEGEVLQANAGYLLSPDCVHESMLMDQDVERTFLRIALPNTFKHPLWS